MAFSASISRSRAGVWVCSETSNRWALAETSATARSNAAALAAAKRAAAEQRVPGRTEAIEYETADGKWHTETAAGSDRPETDIEDKA